MHYWVDKWVDHRWSEWFHRDLITYNSLIELTIKYIYIYGDVIGSWLLGCITIILNCLVTKRNTILWYARHWGSSSNFYAWKWTNKHYTITTKQQFICFAIPTTLCVLIFDHPRGPLETAVLYPVVNCALNRGLFRSRIFIIAAAWFPKKRPA